MNSRLNTTNIYSPILVLELPDSDPSLGVTRIFLRNLTDYFAKVGFSFINSNISYSIEKKIMARTQIKVVRKDGYNGFALAMIIFIPLSIISFFNESANGQFCMWGGCEPPPSYYHYPRVLALVSTFSLLLLALPRSDSRKSGTHGNNYPLGIIPGVILGIIIFMFSSILGFWYH